MVPEPIADDSLPYADCTAEGAYDIHPEDDLVDQYQLLSFDHGGNLVSMAFRTRFDSEPTEEWVMENTYDDGRLIQVDAEYWSNILPVRAEWSLYYEYDDDGNQVVTEHDDRSDGSVEQTTWSTYRNGLLVARDKDSTGDLIVNESTDLVYDEAGNPVKIEIDDDGDGSTDSRWFQDFDSSGNLVLEELDADVDSSLDFRLEHLWDDQGLQIEVTTDSDVDGDADQLESWEHGDRGLVVRYSLDEWADGTVDETTAYTWTCR